MCDVIDTAIRNGKLNYRSEIAQTWDSFCKNALNRKVFIYGIGKATDFFWWRAGGKVVLEGIIDGDDKLWGGNAGWYLQSNEAEHFIIENPDYLNRFNCNEVMVLVSSINHYDEIASRLKKEGINSVYILPVMEAAWREQYGRDNYCVSDEEYANRCRDLPVQKGKCFFSSGNKYREHGKYITESLVKRGLELDIVWILDDMSTKLPNGVRSVYYGNTRRVIYELATSEFYFTDGGIHRIPEKKQGQVFVQTKHWSSVTLKKFYLDSATITDAPGRREEWKNMFNKLDYILVGSDFDEQSCRRGFCFSGQCIRVGSPRSDAMFKHNELRAKIGDLYGISDDINLLTYAPTYRYKSNKKKEYIPELKEIDIDFRQIKEAVERRFGGKWIVMLRLHPSVSKYSTDIRLGDYVIDASNHQDGEEIAAASDIMISDYSSIMFELGYVNKPVFLYAPDRNSYINREYDLLLDYDSLPFPIAENNNQLLHNILSYDETKYKANLRSFLERYGVHEDGLASERAADFIISKMSRED